MPIRLGAIADGDDFFNRVTETRMLWRYMEGNHVLLSGPRRLGKTSLLKHFQQEVGQRGLNAVLVDVEGTYTAAGFIDELARAIDLANVDTSTSARLRRVGTKLRKKLPRMKVTFKMNGMPEAIEGGLELQGAPELQSPSGSQPLWHHRARELQNRISPLPIYILIDEFSVFVDRAIAHNSSETNSLVHWLRSWRQHANNNCRFLFSGSISIVSLLARHGLHTAFNDCFDYRLGPFGQNHSRELLLETATREGWSMEPEIADQMCNRIGWLSPFYLNLFLAGTLNAAEARILETRSREKTVTIDDTDAAWNQLVTSRSGFMHWHYRLQRELPTSELTFAQTVLSVVSNEPPGLTKAQLLEMLTSQEPNQERRTNLLEAVLLFLQEDGYLVAETVDRHTRYRFLSFLLREYWRRNHGS